MDDGGEAGVVDGMEQRRRRSSNERRRTASFAAIVGTIGRGEGFANGGF